MKPEVTLSKLEDAATQIGVKVSYEVLGAAVGHGGLCRVKGEFRVIIDKRASTEERVTTLAGSLARVLPRVEDTSALDVKLRNLIDFHAPSAKAPRAAA
jgi:hypothetical protein